MSRRRKLTDEQRRRFAKKIEERGKELFIREEIERKVIEPKLDFEEIRKVSDKKLLQLTEKPPKAAFALEDEEIIMSMGRAFFKKTHDRRFVIKAEDFVAANSKLSEAEPGTKKFKKLLEERDEFLKEFNEFVYAHKVPESYKKER